jgi:predicted dehydrogenase/acetyltransferase-like isoleucine patch superfamily enzyme
MGSGLTVNRANWFPEFSSMEGDIALESREGSIRDQKTAGAARVAVLGCGYWGKNLVRNFAELGALAAICDPNRAAAAPLADRYHTPVAELDAVLRDNDIAGLAIAAPAALHATLARRAMEAGKHVFVEKPLALTLVEAEPLCALAERQDRRLMVGHLLQYHPAFAKLRELVREGALGRLQYIYSNRLNLGKVRREEDILWSFAPHDLSMILSLVGQEPVEVSAQGGYYLHKTIADVTTTNLTFPGGEQAHVFVSWLHPFKEQKLVVIGDHAMAVFDDGQPWRQKLLLYPHRIEWRETMPVPQRAEADPVLIEEGEPLKLECRHFLDCMATGATPRTDGREGLRVLRVLARASAALRGESTAPAAQKSRPYSNVQIHESAYVDEPCEIGSGTNIWHFVHILPRSRIGSNCSLGQNVMVGPDVTIGDSCRIQNNVSIYKGVTLEDGVFCGPSCVFTNVNNPRAEVERKDEFRSTLVKRGATIGANATIVCGHTLGEHAFIAAGAVVTHDVPAFAMMAGVPARRIGWVSHDGERLGPNLVCPRSGRRYREIGPEHLEEIV